MNRLSAFCFLPLLLIGFQEAATPSSPSSAAPKAAVSPRGADLALVLDAEVQRVDWNRSYEEWTALHPQAVCEAYRAGQRSVVPPVSAKWGYCFQCTSKEGAVSTRATFYPVRDTGALACKLLEFTAWAEAPGEVQDARRELNRLLTSRLGKGLRDHQDRQAGQLYWPSPELEVRSFALSGGGESWKFLLESDFLCSPPGPEKETRRRLLDSKTWTEEQDEDLLRVLGSRMNNLVLTASRVQAGQRLSSVAPGEPDRIGQEKARTERLIEHLRTLNPEVAGLLQKRFDAGQDELRTGLERLLEAARETAGDSRAALLLAADHLARQLHSDEMPDRASQPIVETIAGYRLTFEPDLLGDASWEYRHDLLWEAWKAESIDWSEEAFLELSDIGWSGKEDCFREMIEQGERFLGEAPGRRRAPQVLFSVAQAYETWWSLSRDAGEDGIVDDPNQFKPGSEEALAEAIEAYERLQILAPGSEEAEAAQSRLFYLRRGIDTRERRFYCASAC
jgi:hypothetical protein